EVDRTCQRIAVVRGGRLVAIRTLAELREAAPRRLTVRFSRPVPSPPGSFAAATFVKRDADCWVLDVQGPIGAVIAALSSMPVADVDVASLTLDEAILKLFGEPARC